MQFTVAFSLAPARITPCSQVIIQLFPGPKDPGDIPITVTLRDPPPNMAAGPAHTYSGAASADFVIDVGSAQGNFDLTAVAESPGYSPVSIPISLLVTCALSQDPECGAQICPVGSERCGSNADCTAPMQWICDAAKHGCRGCISSDECAGNADGKFICGAVGECVQCAKKEDCLGLRKACDSASGVCVACTSNEECASGQCDIGTGACADPATVVYVNGYGRSCPAGRGTGKLEDPFCRITDGIAYGASVGRTVVVFATNGNYYEENIKIAPPPGSNYKVSVVGVGTGSSASEQRPTVHLSSIDPAFDLTLGSAASIDVTLDNFWIDTYPGATGAGAVRCQGGTDAGATKLKLTRSIAYGAGYGVKVSHCDATLDRDEIWDADTGVVLESSDFTLQNLIVYNFGGVGAASGTGGVLATGTSARAILVNSTLVSNNATAGVASVACVPGMVFSNDVIIGVPGGGDLPNCSPTYSSFIGAGSAGHNQDLATCGAAALDVQRALFKDIATGDFHPKTGGAAPCTLVGLGTSAAAPTYTFDGKPRPEPPSIGCYEPLP
jgi:hypothetical protein